MEHIVWDKALETGDAGIDAQHRHLFELAASLQTACIEWCDESDRITDAVYELADYVVSHFHDEEEFMERCGYPERSVHAALHTSLAEHAMRFVAGYVDGHAPRAEELSAFVARWFTGHILAEDMRMIEYATRMRT